MTVAVWVAVSRTGHWAAIAGVAHTRITLQQMYWRLYGRTLKEDGYRPVKATLTILPETP